MREKLLTVALAITGLIILIVNFLFLESNLLLLVAIAILLSPGSFFYLSYLKKRAISKNFPLFLRDVSEIRRAGMTLPDAIKAVEKNDYGPLNEHILVLNNQIAVGLEFKKALLNLSKRINDEKISRLLSIIIEAHESGGDITEIFYSTAKSARALSELESERAVRMGTYIITNYCVFFVFLIVIIMLYKVLFPAMRQTIIMPEIFGKGSGIGNIVSSVFFHMTLIQGFFTGIITGKLVEDSLIAGLKHSSLLLFVGSAVFLLLI